MQTRIDVLYPVNRLDELRHALRRQIMGLYRYQNRIGHHQRIDRNHAERRHTIDQDVIIRILDHLNVPFQNVHPRQRNDERYFQRRQRGIGRYKIAPRHDAGYHQPNRTARIRSGYACSSQS